MPAPVARQVTASRDSVRRRDRVRQLEELRRTLRIGTLVVAPILFLSAVVVAIRFPAHGLQLFALWASEAVAVALLHPIARSAPRHLIIRLTLVFAMIPGVALPATLMLEPGTLLMINSALAILPVAVPLFLAWPGTIRTGWLVGYAGFFAAVSLITGFGSLPMTARTDIAVDTAIGCFIGWVGGELLERPRLRTLTHELEMRRLNRVLHGHATTDPLTGLGNRRQLETDLGLLGVSLRQSGAPCAVLLFDLDWFKRLNDELGHVAGDAALRSVAHALKQLVRGRDSVYRYGGEEFLVLLPDTKLPAALEVAERIRRAIEALEIEASVGDHRATLTISGGVAVSDPPHTSWESVLAAADAALYEAKARGRNGVWGEAAGEAPDPTGLRADWSSTGMLGRKPEDRPASA